MKKEAPTAKESIDDAEAQAKPEDSPSPALVLVDVHNRAVLNEGRNFGLAFAFCGRKGNTLYTSHPPSPCRDYLNDVVWVEANDKAYTCCGWSFTKQDLFNDGVGKMIVTVLDYHPRSGVGDYKAKAKDIAYMDKNLDKVQSFLDYFFHKIHKKPDDVAKATIVMDNKYLFEFSTFWCKYPYLISVYSLLLRNAVYGRYDGEDPMKFLKSSDTVDVSMVKMMIPKLERIMAGELPEQKTDSPHGRGICDMAFPLFLATGTKKP